MNYWQYADQPKRSRWHRGDRQRPDNETLASPGQQLSLFDQPEEVQPTQQQQQPEVTDQEFANWLDEWD